MATIEDLVRMSLEELAKADGDGLIPTEIKSHKSVDAVKPWSHLGDDFDQGNFAGSIVMMLLLFPEEYGLGEELAESDTRKKRGNFKLLKCLNGNGDREEPLRREGKMYQKSGKGQNNYRTHPSWIWLDILSDPKWALTGPGPWAHMGPNPHGPGPMGPNATQ